MWVFSSSIGRQKGVLKSAILDRSVTESFQLERAEEHQAHGLAGATLLLAGGSRAV